MKIEKKIWPEFFDKVASGEKTFEYRLADFGCHPGDILVLREWDPQTKKYTGRSVEKKIGYITKIDEMSFHTREEAEKYGFYIISLKN